jgi:transcriptional regulator with XRE-family HTH domain
MLSQQEVAERAGTSHFTIQRIERGEGNVRPKTGRAVAEALGVGIEDLLPKAQAPLPFEEPESAQAERRIMESLFHSWVEWLVRDAAYLIKVTHARRIDHGAHDKIVADRRNTLRALDGLGTDLERLGIDWKDRRERSAVRARRDLQSAFNDWSAAYLEARKTYLDSLTGSELTQARQAHAEEEERSDNTPEWLRAG